MLISEVRWGHTHDIKVGNHLDGYSLPYAQFGNKYKPYPSSLTEQPFKNFFDESQEKETTTEKITRISYGFIFGTYFVPCANGTQKVFCLMPLVEEKDLTPLIKQYYRRLVKKEKNYNVVRFVHGENDKIIAIYMKKENKTINSFYKKNFKVAAIAQCQFIKGCENTNKVSQSFDNFRILGLDAKIHFYPTLEMYKEDYAKFWDRVKGDNASISETFVASILGSNDGSLGSRFKKSILGK